MDILLTFGFGCLSLPVMFIQPMMVGSSWTDDFMSTLLATSLQSAVTGESETSFSDRNVRTASVSSVLHLSKSWRLLKEQPEV